MNTVVYTLTYLVAGLTLKTGDDVLDELDMPWLAWTPLVLSGLMFGLIMTVSQWDFALMTAIVIGVTLAGKVNRVEFAGGFIALVAVLVFVGPPTVTDLGGWVTLVIVLLIAAAADEAAGNWTEGRGTSPLTWLLEHRFVLKACALSVIPIWPQFLPAGLGLWVFDAGYEMAGTLVKRAQSRS